MRFKIFYKAGMNPFFCALSSSLHHVAVVMSRQCGLGNKESSLKRNYRSECRPMKDHEGSASPYFGTEKPPRIWLAFSCFSLAREVSIRLHVQRVVFRLLTTSEVLYTSLEAKVSFEHFQKSLSVVSLVCGGTHNCLC